MRVSHLPTRPQLTNGCKVHFVDVAVSGGAAGAAEVCILQITSRACASINKLLLCQFHRLTLVVSLSLVVSPSHSRCLTLSRCLAVSLSLSHFHSMSHRPTLTDLLCHCLTHVLRNLGDPHRTLSRRCPIWSAASHLTWSILTPSVNLPR